MGAGGGGGVLLSRLPFIPCNELILFGMGELVMELTDDDGDTQADGI